MLEWFDPQVMQYPKSLAVTWQTSVEQLTPAGKQLLEHLAWFAPELIPEFVFDEAKPAALWEKFLGEDVRVALADLRRYSLIRREQTGDLPGFAVHRLVQDITRRRLASEMQPQRLLGALQILNSGCEEDPPPQDVRSWPRWVPLDPHLEMVLTAAERADLTKEPTSRLMNVYGLFLKIRTRYTEAEGWYRRALAIDQANCGRDHPDVAIRLNNLGTLLCATNRQAEAEPLMWRALAIAEANHEPSHPIIALRLNNLAQLLQDTNRLREAESLMRRALAIDEARYGPDHSAVARDLNNLAVLLEETKRLNEAEPLIRRALAIDEKSYGLGHPNVATDLNNLALLLQVTNRLTEAELLLRRAVLIMRESLGEMHPYTLDVKRNYQLLVAQMMKE